MKASSGYGWEKSFKNEAIVSNRFPPMARDIPYWILARSPVLPMVFFSPVDLASS